MKAPIDVAVAAQAWSSLVEQIGVLRAVRTDDDLAEAVALLDALLGATRGNEGSPLETLVGLVGELVEAYETQNYGEPDASPADVLRELMAANGLRQSDLASELGGQSVVSAVLSGHRGINARQASALGRRFGISPAVFLPKAPPVAPVTQGTSLVAIKYERWVKLDKDVGGESDVAWLVTTDRLGELEEARTSEDQLRIDRLASRTVQ